MTEVRKDYLTEEWISISQSRANRPFSFKKSDIKIKDDNSKCPFCIQNKGMTEEETCTVGEARVIPNLYPILDSCSPNGYGIHEVVIDAYDHELSLVNMEYRKIVDVLLAIQNRIRFFREDNNINYIQIFKNYGFNAGASLYHSHWQILAMPFIPLKKETIYKNFVNYNNINKSCYICDITKKLEDFLVYKHNDVVSYSPYACSYYYGINITTTKHFSNFEEIPMKTLYNMAIVLKKSLKALSEILPELHYNICFHIPPFFKDEKNNDSYWHFYFEIIPRVANFAGYELSTGGHICSLFPEQCAENLREIISRLEEE